MVPNERETGIRLQRTGLEGGRRWRRGQVNLPNGLEGRWRLTRGIRGDQGGSTESVMGEAGSDHARSENNLASASWSCPPYKLEPMMRQMGNTCGSAGPPPWNEK